MSKSSTLDLFKWMTEEMEFLPYKVSDAGRVPMKCEELQDVFQGNGEDIWNHIIKHVHSAKRVDSVRKNIMLSRFKAQQKLPEIQKNDYVGNKLNELHDSSSNRSVLLKLKEQNKETEDQVKQLAYDLKVAESKCQYQWNATDDMERKNLILKMAEETAQIKVDTVSSSKHYFKMERGDEPSESDLPPGFKVSLRTDTRITTAAPISKLLDLDLISRRNNDCEVFLDRCCSMATELINERLIHLIGEERVPSSRTASDTLEDSVNVTVSNYNSLMHFNGSKCGNPMPNIKEKDLRALIDQNIMKFSAQQLFEALIQRTSNGITEMSRLRIPSGPHLFTKYSVLGTEESHMKELKDKLSEEITNLNYIISQNVVAAAQEKVVTSRARNTLNTLMSQVERNLKEIFLIDAGMFERAYELVELRVQEKRIAATISSLKNSIQEMQMDIKNKNTLNLQLMKLVEQMKELQREKVHQSGTLDGLQKIRQEIKPIIFSNQVDVQKFLAETKSHHFKSEMEALKLDVGLLNRELKTFIDFPLEYLTETTLPSGSTVPDCQLLLNSTNLASLKMNDQELTEAFGLWVKSTLGKAPHSSTDAIFLAAINIKESVRRLSAARPECFLLSDQILQKNLGKIPDLLAEIDEDEKKWQHIMSDFGDMQKDLNSLIAEHINEAESIYQTWNEGVINKFIPESILVEGKSFQTWYNEVQTTLKRQ